MRTGTKEIINKIWAGGEDHSVEQVTYKATCLWVFPHPFSLGDMPHSPESQSLNCRWYNPLNPASLLKLRDPLGCKPSRWGQPSWSPAGRDVVTGIVWIWCGTWRFRHGELLPSSHIPRLLWASSGKYCNPCPSSATWGHFPKVG